MVWVPPRADHADRPSPVLHILNRAVSGMPDGGSIPLTEGPVAIGRDPARCQLVILDPLNRVNRRHCVVSWADGAFYVEDTRSTNGTLLEDGRRIPPGQWYALQPGQRFMPASSDFMFQVDYQAVRDGGPAAANTSFVDCGCGSFAEALRLHEQAWGRQVPAANGLLWIRKTFGIFFRDPAAWMLASLIMALMQGAFLATYWALLASMFTVYGASNPYCRFWLVAITAACSLCAVPAGSGFAGGVALMADRQLRGETIRAREVFDGFDRPYASRPLHIGLWALLYWWMLLSCLALFSALALRLDLFGVLDLSGKAVWVGIGFAALAAAFLTLLPGFALFLAPTLSVTTDNPALTCMTRALRACAVNWAALLLCGLCMMLLGAPITLLGFYFCAFFPILGHVACRDIFRRDE